MRSRLAGARLFEHACGTAASGAKSSRLSPRPSVGALAPSTPLAFRRPSTPTIGMIANSAFTSSGRPSSEEPPADTTAGDAHLFSGLAKASSGVAMSGAARQTRTAERLLGLIGAGVKPSAAVSASNMAQRARCEALSWQLQAVTRNRCELILLSALQVSTPAGRVPVFGAVFIIAVHRAFVLGLGARHRGIVELSRG